VGFAHLSEGGKSFVLSETLPHLLFDAPVGSLHPPQARLSSSHPYFRIPLYGNELRLDLASFRNFAVAVVTCNPGEHSELALLTQFGFVW
jgi:hypothetical protein